MTKVQIKHLLNSPERIGTEVSAKGWIRTKRESKNAIFLAINDGSTIHNIQAVAQPGQLDDELLKLVTTGSCVQATGTLVASQGSGQAVEIQLSSLHLYGTADPDKYPLQPKRHSLEFLRDIAHLRPRTNTFSAILRIRHALAFAVHRYFNDHGFFNHHHGFGCRRRRRDVSGDNL
jgi:asparaginyl-tRNA synthetase